MSSAYPLGLYTLTLTPAGTTLSIGTTITVTPANPQISAASPGIWYLGPATQNDNCVPNSGDPGQACYYNSGIVAFSPPLYGPVPTATSPMSWSVTDPSTGQAPSFAVWTCTDAPVCSTLRVTATALSCGTVTVRGTLGGLASNPVTIYTDGPLSSQFMGLVIPDQDINGGYLSQIGLALVSACGNRMYSIAVHEQFPAAWQACPRSGGPQVSGWSSAIPQQRTDPNNPATGWGSWITFGDGTYTDSIAYKCDPQNPCTPASSPPGQPLSIQANAWAKLDMFVGSQDTINLGKYVFVTEFIQVRYTDHGRDEVATWACPIQ